MSTFEVKVRTITQMDPHPNADRLELVVVGGYRAVSQKGVHKVGDMIVYVPEDSVFKNAEIATALGVTNYLVGKDKNRVKAIKLRGILSQGIVLPWRVVSDVLFNFKKIPALENFYEGLELSEKLEIEKYEEPVPITMSGQVRRWPSFVPNYDVENIKRPESLAAMVEGEEVVVTEKLHGTNMTVAVGPGLERGEKVFVCSRNLALKGRGWTPKLRDSLTLTWSEIAHGSVAYAWPHLKNAVTALGIAIKDRFSPPPPDTVYWRAVRTYGLDDDVVEMLDYFGAETVSLHGEVVGVQDLKYGLKNGNIGFYAFDIMVDGQFIDYDDFKRACAYFGIFTTPLVYRGPYNYDTIAELASGNTSFLIDDNHIREGVVVKPVVERRDMAAGRVQFKFISEAYLLRSGGTELH